MAKRNAPQTNGTPHLHKPKQTVCPISLREFLELASPVEVTIDGQNMSGNAEPREFSTGSFGWYVNGKVVLRIGGEDVKCQVTGNVIMVGSKTADRS